MWAIVVCGSIGIQNNIEVNRTNNGQSTGSRWSWEFLKSAANNGKRIFNARLLSFKNFENSTKRYRAYNNIRNIQEMFGANMSKEHAF